MKPSKMFYSETGAAKAQVYSTLAGRPVVGVGIPVGTGRRLTLELGIGQARAVHEVLTVVLNEVATKHFGHDAYRVPPRPAADGEHEG